MSARWEHELGALRDVCLEKQVRTDAISSGLIHPKKESVITSSSFFLRKIPKRALSSTPNSFSDIRTRKKLEKSKFDSKLKLTLDLLLKSICYFLFLIYIEFDSFVQKLQE